MMINIKKISKICSVVSLLMLVVYVGLGLFGIIEQFDFNMAWGCFVIAFGLWASQEFEAE